MKNKKKNKKDEPSSLLWAILGGLGSSIGLIVSADEDDAGSFSVLWCIAGIILLVVGAVIAVECIKLGKQKKARLAREKERKEQKERDFRDLDTEKFDRILAYIREHTKCEAVKITSEQREKLGIAESKFGGYPYWPAGMDYPADDKGKPLYLLAQLDLSEVNDSRLPDHGLLQFFVGSDELCGANFDELDDNSGFRIVYHDSVDPAVTEESVKALGIKATMDGPANGDEYLPLETQEKIFFEHVTEYISESACTFDAVVGNALKELYGEELVEESVWKTLNDAEYEYLTKTLDGWGHKLFGYPQFTQGDPRAYRGEEPFYFDALLLQVDSAGGIMWGDCGIANFFISSEDLEKLDFSHVLYTWDCC